MFIVPHTLAAVYYRGVVSIVSSNDVIVVLHALGGAYLQQSLRPHRVTHITVNGVDSHCVLSLRGCTAVCGPLWCPPKRREALLAELSAPALRGGPKWCAPVNADGTYQCVCCNRSFDTALKLFAHGGFAKGWHENFLDKAFTVPHNWRPQHFSQQPNPVPATNLARGSLADTEPSPYYRAETNGQVRTNILRTKLQRLQRFHGAKYHPYRLSIAQKKSAPKRRGAARPARP